MTYLTDLQCSECGRLFNPNEIQTYCQDCQAPLLASTIEKNINSGSGANLLDFRLIILSCTISTILGGLLIPTFQRLLSIAVEKFSIYKSVPKVLIYGFTKSGSLSGD